MQIVSRQHDAARLEQIRVSQHAHGFDRRSDPAFHIRRTAPIQLAGVDPRLNKRKMHGVEVTVELQCFSRACRLQTANHGRRIRPTCLHTLHGKTVLLQDLR